MNDIVDLREKWGGKFDFATSYTSIKSGQEPSDHSIIVRKRTLSCRGGQAAEGIDLLGDIYASESYRAQLVKVYTKRALLAATEASNERATAQHTGEDL